jgi:hypothetical protein
MFWTWCLGLWNLSDIETIAQTPRPNQRSTQAVGAYKKLTKKPDSDRNSLSAIGNKVTPKSEARTKEARKRKPLRTAELGTKKGRLSSSDTGLESNERCRARTCDMLIKSQLLYQLS